MRSRRYGPESLIPPWQRDTPVPEVAAERDLVVEEAGTGFCGAVTRVEKTPEGFTVTLEDRHGKLRVFPMLPRGFLIDGEVVTLVRPERAAPATGPARTAAGSIAVGGAGARGARAGRIYVEGRHDAELVERVWGDDLRIEGVVVEYLEGVDHLPSVVREFRPGPGRRLGVLVDHQVEGSKESRIAARVASPHVLIAGHPFIDIWEAVKPAAVGIRAWPRIPRGVPWKEGVIAELGWGDNTGAAWKRILNSVNTYTDLEPALLGRVEELIDFVTV